MSRPLRRAGLAALALLVPLLAASLPLAGGTGSGASFATEAAFLTTTAAQSPTNWQAFDGNDFAIYDVNHDGKPEVVISNDNLRHYVIDPRLGRVVAELQTTYYPGYGGRDLDAPAVGDLYGNGTAWIAIENGAAHLSLWKYVPQGSTATQYNLSKQWEAWTNSKLWDPNFAATHPYNANESPTSEGHPFLADVDGTGTATIFSNAEDVSTGVAYTPTGTLRWFHDPPSDLNAGVAIADLRGDGHREAIFASDFGPIYVYDAASGSFLWQFDTRCTGGAWAGNGSNCDWSQPSSISVTPAIVDLFGDGRKEICFGSRFVSNYNDPNWTSTDPSVVQALVDASHARLWCVGPDGRQVWMQQYPWLNPHVDVRPVAFDVNGDGVKDLIWIDWNTIGHHPGTWQTTTRGPTLFALDGRTGALLWRTSLAEAWSNKGFALADALGDGRQLIVAEEWGPGGDGVSLIDPHTGARVGWSPLHAGYEASRGPVVADLNGDGKMEVVVPMMRGTGNQAYCSAHLPDVGCREGALDVLATGKPFSSIYSNNQLWNIPGAGGVGSPPPPPPPPPGPSGTFAATFTLHSPNEWWEQVTVQPASARTLAQVQVRLNGGAWTAMVHQSYGDWTASLHAVAGTAVEFLATDGAGPQSQSLPFKWMDGTASQGSTAPTPGSGGAGAFAATFTPSKNINAWWVEVAVSANHPIAAVAASVNNGAWIALPLDSWGTWAKSFHVASGSNVRFQATDTGGATATSGATTWP